jgi:hypothetical protein
MVVFSVKNFTEKNRETFLKISLPFSPSPLEGTWPKSVFKFQSDAIFLILLFYTTLKTLSRGVNKYWI